MATNAYLVGDDEKRECFVVDPGAEGERILAVLKRMGLALRMIVATHGHPDHVGAVAFLKEATGAPFGINPRDVPLLEEWGAMFGHGVLSGYRDPPHPDVELAEGDAIQAGDVALSVIETPGHTPGGISLYGHGILLCGDTLFNAGIGRCDLPGGDGHLLLESIRTRLLALPGDTKALPGHGDATTIGWERDHNPFLRGGLEGEAP
jgi:glyoxylase-like metal-dependent hydrolase (beta-lactamase superfamily II)